MKNAWKAVLVGLAIAGGTPTANADWTDSWNSFWDRVELDYLRNSHWPQPFVYPDREAVRAPFATMVAKGWQRQNTLGDYHFDPNTHELNQAGQMRLRWIANQVDPQRRAVFVYRGLTQEITAARINSVHHHLANTLRPEFPPMVMDTAIPPVDRPGEQIDQIQTRALSSTPEPILPPYQPAGSQGP